MEVVLLTARVTLALVFGVAGIAKMADFAGSRRALTDFGVPEWMSAPLSRSLPFVEVMVALALIPRTTAWWAAIAAAVLLLAFAGGIGLNLARGNSPDCHCFGQLHSKPVSSSTFTRNLILMAVAGLIIVQGRTDPGLSAVAWLGELKTAETLNLVLGFAAVALLATAVVYLRRVLKQQSAILGRIEAMKKVIDEDYAELPVERAEAAAPVEGLPIGAAAPEFSLATVGGDHVALSDLLSYGKSVLLLFVSPNCAPCKALMPFIKSWEHDYGNQLTIALLSKGNAAANQSWMAEVGVSHALLQGESSVAEEYEAKWTPAAVMIRSDGKIASSVTYGDEAIRALVNRAVAPPDIQRKRSLEVKGNGHKPQIIIATPHAMSDLGKLAPEFSLPDPDGNIISTEDLLGRDTLLLFWNPSCPFCSGMTEEINRWESDSPKESPRLIFISSGEEEDVRVESAKFKSQFLIDPELEVGGLFGTNLTPSAVLIDRQGRIASPPTAGPERIMSLAGVRKSIGQAALSN